MLPNINEDLLAIGQDHKFNLLSQSVLNSCTQYGKTYLCKGPDVLRTDLDNTCLGSYYLKNFDSIHSKCKFDLIQPQEHIFQITSNKGIISSLSDFSTIIKCPSTFQSVTIRKLAQCCPVVKRTSSPTLSHQIQTSNIMFPRYHTYEFEATLIHLRNITAISIDNINEAVATALANSKSGKKTVEQYFKDLENIKLDKNKPITSVVNVFITMLAFVSIATCYLLFKICFTLSHSIKPLFSTFRPRERTKRSRKRSFDKMNKDIKEI
jgi:hypothetical protein